MQSWVRWNFQLKTDWRWLAAKATSSHGFKTNSVQMHLSTLRCSNMFGDRPSNSKVAPVHWIYKDITRPSLPFCLSFCYLFEYLFFNVQFRFIFVFVSSHLTRKKQSNHPEAIWMAFYESCGSNSRKFDPINNIKVEHLRRIKTNGFAFTFNNHRIVMFLFSTLSVCVFLITHIILFTIHF